jgi:DNA polymerase V
MLEKHKVIVCSSNYELYGDISRRMMDVLGTMAGDLEVYSIDEAFLQLLSTTVDHNQLGQHIKATVWKSIGMPVCVGIAPTKTLAKLANRAAKKIARLNGVCTLDTTVRQEWVLQRVNTSDIWGVGDRISTRLGEMGIHTGLDLARASPKHLRKSFSVVLERTVRELNGESCMPLELQPASKQEILCSRSFSKKLRDLVGLQEAIASYAARACEKLRAQNTLTSTIRVFVESNRFSGTYYVNQRIVKLAHLTNDTRTISSAARQAVGEMFRPDTPFHKCGIGLLDLREIRPEQIDFFSAKQSAKSQDLMVSLDAINRRFGRGTLALASQGIRPEWRMSRDMLSPSYTTKWSDIPKVRC